MEDEGEEVNPRSKNEAPAQTGPAVVGFFSINLNPAWKLNPCNYFTRVRYI
jgi:hypothetical protein